jgi:hypothetical protein
VKGKLKADYHQNKVQIPTTPALDQVVWIITNLPDQWLNLVGLKEDWDNTTSHSVLFNAIRRKYRAIGLWLNYYLLGNESLLEELTITDKSVYQPFAEELRAVLVLAQEVWLRSESAQSQIRSPHHWVLICAYQNLGNELEGSGYANVPTNKGKSHSFKDITDILTIAQDPYIWTIDKEDLEAIPPFEALLTMALDMAQGNEEFNTRYYLPFIKTIKRCYRTIDRDPSIKAVCADQNDGHLYLVKAGKRSQSKGLAT